MASSSASVEGEAAQPAPEPREPPPPYSQEADQTTSGEQDDSLFGYKTDPDLDTCSHWHTMLVSIVDGEEPSNPKRPPSPRTVLHFWPPKPAHNTTSSSSTYFPTRLDVNDIRNIQGYRELGTFILPASRASGPEAIHQFLTSLAESTSSAEPMSGVAQEVLEAPEVVESIGAQLLALKPPAEGGLPVTIVAISICSDSADALFRSGVAPAWKWAKITSNYGSMTSTRNYESRSNYQPRTGCWEIDVARAVEDAGWSAGRDSMLLVRGFAEEHREELMKNRQQHMPGEKRVMNAALIEARRQFELDKRRRKAAEQGDSGAVTPPQY